MAMIPILLDALTRDAKGGALLLYTAYRVPADDVVYVDWKSTTRPGATPIDIGGLSKGLPALKKTFHVIVIGEDTNPQEKVRLIGLCFRSGVVAQPYVICALHERTEGGVLTPPDNSLHAFTNVVRLNYPECSTTVLKSSAGWVSLHSSQKPPNLVTAPSHRVID